MSTSTISPGVLIVDDSAVMRKILKKALSMSGLAIGAVHEAPNGRDALEILAREQVSLVFVDINMPEMNGIALLERMRDTGAGAAVVVVSTERSEARIARLAELGARYLAKPFRPEEVGRVASAALAERIAGRSVARA